MIKNGPGRYTTYVLCSPAVIDLDGDGLELISPTLSGITTTANGGNDKMGWVGPDDGILFYDSNNNNRADLELEYVHTQRWNNGSATDIEAIRNDDSNSDGLLSSLDSGFSKYKIWRDINGDGVSTTNEVFSLSSYNITSINLNTSGYAYFKNGNAVFGETTANLSGGGNLLVGDVGLALEGTDSFDVDFDLSTGHIFEHDNDKILQWMSNNPLTFNAATSNFKGESNFVGVLGGNGNDNLSNSSSSSKRLFGGRGNDTLTSQNAADKLYGGDGNDTIHGNNGNDILSGDGGTDYLYGGSGSDTYLINKGSDKDIISDSFGYDTLRFEDGISKNDLTFVKLYTKLMASNSDVTIEVLNWPFGNGTHYIENWEFYDGSLSASYINSIANVVYPVVFDLDNDGLELIKPQHSNVYVDVDGDGVEDQLGWVGADDAFLVIDRNNNGIVDSILEISFILDKPGAKTDLEGLQGHDSNGDMIFDSYDENFEQFFVWRDINQNGQSDEGELMTMAQMGIQSIDLNGTPTGETKNGYSKNIVFNETTFTWSNGDIGLAGDVGLVYKTKKNNKTNGLASAASTEKNVPLDISALFVPRAEREKLSCYTLQLTENCSITEVTVPESVDF